MNKPQYDDALHMYWYGPTRYMSATQIIEHYRPKFDAKAVAEEYSLKAGRDPDYWLSTWKQTNKTSLVRGNNLHDLREEIVLNRSIDVLNGKPYRVQNPDLLPEDLPYIDYPDGIYTEQMVWNHDYQIAGRVDRFAIETIDGTRFIHIEDYKTNRRLRRQSYFNYTTQSYTMMLPPLSHLMDCEMVHYTLQLSEYMFMFEAMGFAPGTIQLLHFPHIPAMAPEGATQPDPVSYPLSYNKQDVITMLTHFNTHK